MAVRFIIMKTFWTPKIVNFNIHLLVSGFIILILLGYISHITRHDNYFFFMLPFIIVYVLLLNIAFGVVSVFIERKRHKDNSSFLGIKSVYKCIILITYLVNILLALFTYLYVCLRIRF